jgi:hypothetical protein
VVTGDYGANFVTDTVGLDGVRRTAYRRNQELVRGQDKFAGKAGTSVFGRRTQQAPAAFRL